MNRIIEILLHVLLNKMTNIRFAERASFLISELDQEMTMNIVNEWNVCRCHRRKKKPHSSRLSLQFFWIIFYYLIYLFCQLEFFFFSFLLSSSKHDVSCAVLHLFQIVPGHRSSTDDFTMLDTIQSSFLLLLIFVIQGVAAFSAMDAIALIIGLVIAIFGICALIGYCARRRSGWKT